MSSSLPVILSLSFLFCACGSLPASDVLWTDDELHVYRAVIAAFGSKREGTVFISDSTISINGEAPWKGYTEWDQINVSKRLLDANRKPRPLPRRNLLDLAEDSECDFVVTTNADGIREVSESESILLKFSAPAFDPDKGRAVVYVESYSGVPGSSGMAYWLRVESGRWRVYKEISDWID